jgi:hypothetical protein
MKPKLTGGAISEFDDPDGLLEGNPETKRYTQPDGLTFEVQRTTLQRIRLPNRIRSGRNAFEWSSPKGGRP